MSSTEHEHQFNKGAVFRTTRWAIVVDAAEELAAKSHPRKALERLCRDYWFPLYAYVRRFGYSVHDAQDLTQDFFAHLISKEGLRNVDKERGRFRTFLLTSLKNFIHDERRRSTAKRRGGKNVMISIDEVDAEGRYSADSSGTLAPDEDYQLKWASTLLERVISRLGDEFTKKGKQDVFETLAPYLWGSKTGTPYREAANLLKMTEGAVKVAVNRMRHRHRELLRAEILHTVGSPEEVESEIRNLIDIYRR